MQSFRGFARQEISAGSTFSARKLSQKYELAAPLSLKAVLTPPLVFEKEFSTSGLASLSGWFKATINKNGSIHWQGHAHDGGLDGYDFRITALIRPL